MAKDRQERTAWAPKRRIKNDLIYLTSFVAIRLALALPRGARTRLGRLVGRVAHSVLARARRTARTNVSLVFPDLAERARTELVRHNFVQLGENLADTVALLDPKEDPGRNLFLEPEAVETLKSALGKGRGVVYLTAHLGPWERMAALLASLGFPISTVARESYDARFHGLVYDRLRAARNVRAIYRGSPGAATAMIRALRQGRVLGFLADLPGRVPVRPVRLVGQPSWLPIGPARVALATGSPLVIGTPSPVRPSAPGKTEVGSPLRVQIEPISTDDLSGDEGAEDLLTQRIADALGERIRALPTHWPWMHPSFSPHPKLAMVEDRPRPSRAPVIADGAAEPIDSYRGDGLV